MNFPLVEVFVNEVEIKTKIGKISMRNCSTSHGRTNDTEWVSNLIRTADDPGENDRSITHQSRERERERQTIGATVDEKEQKKSHH